MRRPAASAWSQRKSCVASAGPPSSASSAPGTSNTAPGSAPVRQASTTTRRRQPRAANMTATPSVPASSSLVSAGARGASRRSTSAATPSSLRVGLPQPMTAITGPSDPPQAAIPLGLDRHRQLGQVAPFAVHQEIDALHAAQLVLSVRLVEKAADDELALEVVGGEPADLADDLQKFLFGLGKRLDDRFKPAFEHLRDRAQRLGVLFVGGRGHRSGGPETGQLLAGLAVMRMDRADEAGIVGAADMPDLDRVVRVEDRRADQRLLDRAARAAAVARADIPGGRRDDLVVADLAALDIDPMA